MRPCGSRYVWSDWVTVKVARGRRRRWRQRRGLMVAYVCDAAQVAFTATTISWSVARSLAHSFMHSFVIRYHSFRFVSSRFGRICNLHGQQQYSQMSFNWFASFPSTCDRAHTHTHTEATTCNCSCTFSSTSLPAALPCVHVPICTYAAIAGREMDCETSLGMRHTIVLVRCTVGMQSVIINWIKRRALRSVSSACLLLGLN